MKKPRKLNDDSLTGYLFISPAFLLIALFYVFPIFFTVFVSLHKWRIKKSSFLGLENYRELFGTFANIGLLALAIAAIFVGFRLVKSGRLNLKAVPATGSASRYVFGAFGAVVLAAGLAGIIFMLPQIWTDGDDDMLDSLRVTMWYSVGTVPVQIIFGMILAVLLDRKFRGKQFFRVVFLLPYIVPAVASATVFERLFSLRAESFANLFIGMFGAPPKAWLGEVKGIFELAFGWGTGGKAGSIVAQYWRTWAQGPALALVSIMFFNYWSFVGYYALIFANGLSNIPRQLYEAAEVDGARKWTVFSKIVIPMLSPTTFFLTLLGVIGTFKAFNHIYVLRTSAIRGAADPMSIYIFFTFFRKSRFGYAAGLALVLFIIVTGLTVLQRRIMEKRVFYGE